MKEMAERGFRYADIFPYTLRLLSEAPSCRPALPPERVFPENFDDIYRLRDKLAAFEMSIGRDAVAQAEYYALIATLGNTEQVIIDKYFNGTDQYVIVLDDYPATLPSDTSHYLMWYLDESSPTFWVADRISDFIIDQGLTNQDFVAYRKPQDKGPFMPGFSRSIEIAHVHLLTRNKRT